MQEWLQKDYVRPYVRLLCRLLLTFIAILILSWALPAFFSFFLPFILAFLVASAMNPLICFFQRKWNISRSILSVLMVALALLFVAAILGGFIYALGREIVALAQNIDGILESFSQTIASVTAQSNWLLHYLPTDTEEILSGLLGGFMTWIQSQGTALADRVITQTVTVTTRVGGGIVTLVIFILASYFIMADYSRFTGQVRKYLSPKTYKGYSTLKEATLSAFSGYLKAQLLMAFVTFSLSLVALLVIRQEFALIIAVLLGILDFVPVIGTSIILVPWAIINILNGAYARGVYLFALSVVAFLIRRIIEPKIVGSQMGLSPLTALASIYIGMQLGGVVGLILGPIVAMVLVNLYKAGLFNGWIKDVNAVLDLQRRKDL